MGQRLALAMKKRGVSQQDVADAAGVGQPTISKLKRGDTKESPVLWKIARRLGVPVEWLEEGVGDEPNWDSPPSTPYVRSRVAHSVSQPQQIVTPQTLSRNEWMTATQLPDEFQLALIDDALGDDYQAGGTMRFTCFEDPTPGEPVLVEDSDGNRAVRYYTVGRGSAWLATAKGNGYQALESERDGLRVLAVFYGYDKPRKRRGSN